MKKILFALCMVILVPLATNAATVGWEKVTTFVDGTPIPAAMLTTIKYQVYFGPDKANLAPGASVVDAISAPASDPPIGETWWYSVTAALPGGPESAKAIPASKTVAIPPVSPPAGCTVR
jgi:hypothetical protein